MDFDIPQNQSVQITRVNNCYMPTTTYRNTLKQNQPDIESTVYSEYPLLKPTSTNGKSNRKMISFAWRETEKQ